MKDQAQHLKEKALTAIVLLQLTVPGLSPRLTSGSNRSLRSLGPAKAGPLTKRYAGSKNMKRNYLKSILISFSMVSYNALAGQAGLNLEPLEKANIECAAFYIAAQVLIKPEAKKEYESKSNTHYALSYQLSSSPETISSKLNSEIQRQATEALSLKEHAQALNFLTGNSIKCTAIEINSTGVIKNNAANQ